MLVQRTVAAGTDGNAFPYQQHLNFVPSSPTRLRRDEEEWLSTFQEVEDPKSSLPTERPHSTKRVRKCVCFAEDAKPHDGLSPRSLLLETLLVAFFVDEKDVNESMVVKLVKHKYNALLELEQDVQSLVGKLMDDQSAPMLARGGGAKGYKLSEGHLPYLVALYQVIRMSRRHLL